MKLNQKLILTGFAVLIATIAYICKEIADSYCGMSFPLQFVIWPSLILVLLGIFVVRE